MYTCYLDETLIHSHHDGVVRPTVKPGTPPDFVLRVCHICNSLKFVYFRSQLIVSQFAFLCISGHTLISFCRSWVSGMIWLFIRHQWKFMERPWQTSLIAVEDCSKDDISASIAHLITRVCVPFMNYVTIAIHYRLHKRFERYTRRLDFDFHLG